MTIAYIRLILSLDKLYPRVDLNSLYKINSIFADFMMNATIETRAIHYCMNQPATIMSVYNICKSNTSVLCFQGIKVVSHYPINNAMMVKSIHSTEQTCIPVNTYEDFIETLLITSAINAMANL